MVVGDTNTSDKSTSTPPSPSSSDRTSTQLESSSPSHLPITRPNGLPPLYVDVSHLPQPWINTKYRKASILSLAGEGVQRESDELVKSHKRPLKQEEAEAFVFHWAKGISTYYNHGVAGLAVAAALSWRGRRTFRFPLYGSPKWTRCSPDRFLFLRGRMARLSWHTLRFTTYEMISGPIIEALFMLFGLSVGIWGYLRDPRLKDFVASRPEGDRGPLSPALVLSERLKQAREERTARTSSDESAEIAKQLNGCRRQDDGHDVKIGASEGAGDGTTGDGTDMPHSGSSFADDSQDQHQPTDRKALLEAMRRYDGKDVNSGTGDSWDDSYRDQSPSPIEDGSHTSSPASTAAESQPSGSAWDRLRQEADRTTAQNPQRPLQSNAGTPSGDDPKGRSEVE